MPSYSLTVAYTWQVDNFLMDQTMATIRRILTDSLLSGDTSWQQRWWMNGFLDPSYERGTTESAFTVHKQITQGIDSPSTNAIAIIDAEAQTTNSALSKSIAIAARPSV